MCSHNTKEQISHYMNGIIIENLKLTNITKKFYTTASFARQ